MTASLSDEQVRHFWDRGYVSRIPILSPDEAATQFAELERREAAAVEAGGGTWEPRDYRPWEHDEHPLWDWADALVRHPVLLDAVESILGPDILVRNADVFVKNAKVRRGIGWHTDTAEKGADADRMLTVWLGLTPSTVKNGCLRFSAGTHRIDIPHGPTDKHHLTLNKQAVAHLDPEATVHNVMMPGEASFHHFRTVHGSGPNRTRERRVGFVVRYMSPEITPETAESGVATLVRGEDTTGNFMLKERFPMTWTD